MIQFNISIKKRTIAFFFSLAFCISILQATAFYSVVATGNWNTASTWNSARVPTVNDDVVISIGNNITVDNTLNAYCKSLTINGKLIYNSAATFEIGTFNDRTSACLINGTLEYSVGYSFRVYGYMKFNTGSTFLMTSGGMTIDGTLGAATSVAAGQAHLDVTDIGTLTCSNSTIVLRNPHYDPTTPCLKGAKTFGNTISFGAGNTTDVANDYLISETDKPIFTNLEINFSSSSSRLKATNIQINAAVGVLSGAFYSYNAATPIKIKGDFNVNQGVTLTGNFEFNGTSQQNINPEYLSGATLATFNGDIIVNNPSEVKSKINVTITGGNLKFTQGRFDTEAKTLTLERTPTGVNANNYIITYNFYQDIGTLLIQNLTGSTLFPVGTSNHYAPVTVNAASGNFKASVTPLQTAVPPSLGYSTVDLEWNIQRVSGPTADITVQWNTVNESPSFSSLRSYCRLFHHDGTTWGVVSSTGGAHSVGPIHTKTTTAVNSFSPFAMFTSLTLPVEITQFTGKQQGQRAQLSWTTASEKNNVGFEIQRNTEESSFQSIGFVKSKGNTNALTDYVFWDNNFTKTRYYRLKQTDIDGSETFSKVITLENNAKSNAITVFPNPIENGLLNIQLADNATAEAISVEVFNANGQKLSEQKDIAPIQTNDWQTGIYFIRIINNANVVSLKVVKQ